MRILSLICIAVPLLANEEYRVIDRLVKAQRAVEQANASGDKSRIARANKRSDQAGAEATAYCKSQGKQLMIKPNGLMGCVARTGDVPTSPPPQKKPTAK